MKAVEKFASLLCEMPAQLDTQTRETTFLHTVDSFAAWAAGFNTHEGQRLLDFERSLPGADGAFRTGSLLPSVRKHCGLARLSEIDDIHLTAAVTPGALVVPATILVAKSVGVTQLSSVLSAVAAGYEAGCQLGVAIGGTAAFQRGIWPTYFVAPFMVAAAITRILGLDAERTAHALALSIVRTSANTGAHSDQATARWLSVGRAAEEGVLAAFAAEAGFRADLTVLDGDFLSQVYGIELDANLFGGIGDSGWAVAGTSFKPWCAARQTINPAAALRQFIEREDSPVIENITAYIPPPMVRMTNHGVIAGDRASHLTSLPYQLAIAALEPTAAYDVQQCPDTIAPNIRELMKKVKVIGDDQLLSRFPALWPSRIEITVDKHTHNFGGDVALGDPGTEFGRIQLASKIMNILGTKSGATANRLTALLHEKISELTLAILLDEFVEPTILRQKAG